MWCTSILFSSSYEAKLFMMFVLLLCFLCYIIAHIYLHLKIHFPKSLLRTMENNSYIEGKPVKIKHLYPDIYVSLETVAPIFLHYSIFSLIRNGIIRSFAESQVLIWSSFYIYFLDLARVRREKLYVKCNYVV